MFTISILASIVALAAACGLPAHIERRQMPKTAITNVHVFDGANFGPLTTLVIAGGIITNAPPYGATVYDGKGGYLIPGLIDCHCHITSCSYLSTMQQYGVTTALDMGQFPYSAITACKKSGLTDVKGSGAAGIVNGTALSFVPGFPKDSYIPNPTAGRAFVTARLKEGVDYIKVYLDPLGPDEATLAAVVQAAHQAGKKVITHAPGYDLYTEAEQASVDIPCHVPLDKALDNTSVQKLNSYHANSVPTLIMMQSIVNNTGAPYAAYQYGAEASVTAMHTVGVPLAAGSDANTIPSSPANPPFGLSLHEELQLLVQAGLSNIEALKSATSQAAATFGYNDRGAIKNGLRADLVLLSADPTVDIRNTLKITKVWVQGV